MSRGSAVGIRTSCALDDQGIGLRVPVASRISTSLHLPDLFWGPSILLSNWVPRALIPGLKGSGSEANHSHLTSAYVKKTWIYIFRHTCVFMTQCLVKHRDNFTFSFAFTLLFTDSSGRAVWSMNCLRPPKCWGRGWESYSRQRCLYAFKLLALSCV
jgi:hypothetical protein